MGQGTPSTGPGEYDRLRAAVWREGGPWDVDRVLRTCLRMGWTIYRSRARHELKSLVADGVLVATDDAKVFHVARFTAEQAADRLGIAPENIDAFVRLVDLMRTPEADAAELDRLRRELEAVRESERVHDGRGKDTDSTMNR
ncbi:hypothetical protein SHXM_08742 [Streptomyces hygroscopicus]|nr:hypothetical protein SHXM_08742 [Streptomyces hygroscopicus]